MRWTSGQFQDIAQVLSRNFNWLTFTLPLVDFSGPSDEVSSPALWL
jgi:hypothetical protein